MKKVDIGVDKSEIKFLFEALYKRGKINEAEYKKILDKFSTYKIQEIG